MYPFLLCKDFIQIFRNLIDIFFFNSYTDTFNSVNKLVKPFDFKRTKHSKQQIINQLYDHLKTIFSTQSSIIFDEINN